MNLFNKFRISQNLIHNIIENEQLKYLIIFLLLIWKSTIELSIIFKLRDGIKNYCNDFDWKGFEIDVNGVIFLEGIKVRNLYNLLFVGLSY